MELCGWNVVCRVLTEVKAFDFAVCMVNKWLLCWMMKALCGFVGFVRNCSFLCCMVAFSVNMMC